MPAFQFYTGDWLKDPELSMCSPSTRGIWIDLLCAMHEMDRSGQITGTTEQLARLCRCTAVNFVQALEELKATNTATVTERNGKVTVINRRMKREDRERKSRNERALRYRQKMKRESNAESDGERNAKVTCISSSSSSSSIKENNNIKEKITFSFQSGGFENITSEDILAWSEAYPAVDVQLSIKQAAQWLISNPSKLKKNYRRFLTNWFARTQEKGGNKHAPKSNPNHRPNFSEQDWGQELIPTGKNEM